MVWKKTWNGSRKKAVPNRLSDKPNISFRFNSGPEILGYLKMLARGKDKSEFINKAIQMRHYFLSNKQRFIAEIIRDNFQLTKHLLRKEGSRIAVTNK